MANSVRIFGVVVQWSMEITLGNVLVALSVIITGVIGAVKGLRFLERRFDWLDEMYYFWCKENGRRVPDSLAKKFVKANGDEPQTRPESRSRHTSGE